MLMKLIHKNEMNLFCQEILYKYLPPKQHIFVLTWILWGDYDGMDESPSNTDSQNSQALIP